MVVGVLAAIVVGVLVALLVTPILGIALLVVAGAAWMLWIQSSVNAAKDAVVGSLGSPVDPDSMVAFRNALNGVAILTGVSEPDLRLIDSPAANAMIAADGDTSTVVITAGLLEGQGTVQKEVLAAELLCRLRDGSARLGTLAAGLPPLVRRAAGLGPASLASTLGDQRATRTDFDAVAVTRYPPGLIEAFESMAERGTAVPGADPETAPLWIAPAVGLDAGVHPEVERTANQPLEYRISVLREL